jgi:hypothetical protein
VKRPRFFTILLIAFGAVSTIAFGVNQDSEGGPLAFPGAEGYGRFAQGGRGGDVYIVTNLKDDGRGSLRYGIESQEGPRTIVFAVSGTIALRSTLEIMDSHLTIAGQTAPGDGICIRDYGLKISEVNDIIMRYIRIRMGDENKGSSSGADCITSEKISDVIFDHISVGWGIDAIHDNRKGGNFTLQWSIYGETLHDTIHYEGAPHSKLGSMRETTKNISFHHNLLHSSHDRHPTLGGSEMTPGGTIIDFRNNLIYNADGQTNFGNAQLNVINNYYRKGPDTDPRDLPMKIKGQKGSGPDPTGFTSGNVFAWNCAWTDDNYSAIQYIQKEGGKYMDSSQVEWELPGELVFGPDRPRTQSAEDARDLILFHVGASKNRDACDDRIVNEVKTSTGQIPDSQNDVGGWPMLNSLSAPADRDKDGMADDWEIAKGLSPADAEDRNKDRNSDGFTNLEEYINSLVEMPYIIN